MNVGASHIATAAPTWSAAERTISSSAGISSEPIRNPPRQLRPMGRLERRGVLSEAPAWSRNASHRRSMTYGVSYERPRFLRRRSRNPAAQEQVGDHRNGHQE